MTSRRMILLILLSAVVAGCNVATERPTIPPPERSMSFLGDWEGIGHYGAVECRIRFDEKFVEIEYIGDQPSRHRDAYTATNIGNEIVLKIQNMDEPLSVFMHKGKLRFNLNEQDRWKESAPRIAMYTFRRPEHR